MLATQNYSNILYNLQSTVTFSH